MKSNQSFFVLVSRFRKKQFEPVNAFFYFNVWNLKEKKCKVTNYFNRDLESSNCEKKKRKNNGKAKKKVEKLQFKKKKKKLPFLFSFFRGFPKLKK